MSIDSLLSSDLGQTLLERTRSMLDELAASVARDLYNQDVVDSTAEGEEVFSRLLSEAVYECDATGSGDRDDPDELPVVDGSDLPVTSTAPKVELTEGLTTGDTADGRLHVYRLGESSLPWDGLGLNTAIKSYWDAALVPDASGMVGGEVAPGLEGWNEVVNSGESGQYHGYRDYLEQNYPGGYEAWDEAFDDYRRVALNGDSLDVRIYDTSGLRYGMDDVA
jgi:hypothetical protein